MVNFLFRFLFICCGVVCCVSVIIPFGALQGPRKSWRTEIKRNDASPPDASVDINIHTFICYLLFAFALGLDARLTAYLYCWSVVCLLRRVIAFRLYHCIERKWKWILQTHRWSVAGNTAK